MYQVQYINRHGRRIEAGKPVGSIKRAIERANRVLSQPERPASVEIYDGDGRLRSRQTSVVTP